MPTGQPGPALRVPYRSEARLAPPGPDGIPIAIHCLAFDLRKLTIRRRSSPSRSYLLPAAGAELSSHPPSSETIIEPLSDYCQQAAPHRARDSISLEARCRNSNARHPDALVAQRRERILITQLVQVLPRARERLSHNVRLLAITDTPGRITHQRPARNPRPHINRRTLVVSTPARIIGLGGRGQVVDTPGRDPTP
jgi:hypothetical protein